MKVKKLGHCCLVVEVNGKKVMTDPGVFSTLQEKEKNIDIIIITHEHPDHYHLESLKKVLVNNPNSIIITNNAVGKLLKEAEITHEILEDEQFREFNGVYVEAHGDKHAFIRSGLEPVQNTGYFIGKDLFYPGDALTNPNKAVRILALPVSAPWLTIENVLQYAREVNPKIAFSVHDGMLNEFGLGYVKKVIPDVLKSFGINFLILELGKEENL